MATTLLGTNATTSLVSLIFSAAAADADIATIQQGILDDAVADGTASTQNGDTHTNTTIDSLVSTVGLHVGDLVAGSGVAAGTTIASIDSATAITVSDATTASASVDLTFFTQRVWPGAFAKNGLLAIPNRGIVKVLAGDYVAVDPVTGWPILVSAFAAAHGPFTIT